MSYKNEIAIDNIFIGQMQRNWAWFDFDLKLKVIIEIMIIQSFT